MEEKTISVVCNPVQYVVTDKNGLLYSKQGVIDRLEKDNKFYADAEIASEGALRALVRAKRIKVFSPQNKMIQKGDTK